MKPIRTELVISPAMMLNTPIKASTGDNADAYSFMSHRVAAGHRNRKKSGMLMSAVRQPTIIARI